MAYGTRLKHFAWNQMKFMIYGNFYGGKIRYFSKVHIYDWNQTCSLWWNFPKMCTKQWFVDVLIKKLK
jgi:hypothetical protein